MPVERVAVVYGQADVTGSNLLQTITAKASTAAVQNTTALVDPIDGLSRLEAFVQFIITAKKIAGKINYW